MGVSDHLLVLDHGRKLAEGTPEQIRSNPDVIEAYLGVADAESEAEHA
jgi:branched-chain amino acid transport system ATP-binding protein